MRTASRFPTRVTISPTFCLAPHNRARLWGAKQKVGEIVTRVGKRLAVRIQGAGQKPGEHQRAAGVLVGVCVEPDATKLHTYLHGMFAANQVHALRDGHGSVQPAQAASVREISKVGEVEVGRAEILRLGGWTFY